MKAIPVRIPSSLSAAQIREWVAQAAARSELQIKTVGTLAKYRGCIHWHIVKPGEKGTLELTYWPQTGEIWFAVHTNRQAAWIQQQLPTFKKHLEAGVKLTSPA